MRKHERVKVPALAVIRDHARALVLGTFIALATFVLFYLMTVFALSWGTNALGYSRPEFLLLQLFAVVFFALTIPLSAVLADRYGRRLTMILVTAAIVLFGLVLAPMFGSGSLIEVMLFMAVGLALMGMTYGPLGTLLSELFPPQIRYTGSSLAPYAATWLATNYGLSYVGYYLSVSSLITLCALLLVRKEEHTAAAVPA